MNRLLNWIYNLYVGFRTLIGWYRVRELWIAMPPIDQEDELHVDEKIASQMFLSSRHEFEDLLNLQGAIAWSDCWMERVLYVGHLGNWPTNRDLMPGALFHEGVNLNTKETVDSSFYLPSSLLNLPDNPTGDINLYSDRVGEVPTVCVIHCFNDVESAKTAYRLRVERIMSDCQKISNIGNPCDMGRMHYE